MTYVQLYHVDSGAGSRVSFRGGIIERSIIERGGQRFPRLIHRKFRDGSQVNAECHFHHQQHQRDHYVLHKGFTRTSLI